MYPNISKLQVNTIIFCLLGRLPHKPKWELKETKCRIQTVNRAYYSILSLINCPDISRRVYVIPYKNAVRGSVLYGSETWTLSHKTINRIGLLKGTPSGKYWTLADQGIMKNSKKSGEAWGSVVVKALRY
jgi:hypothetical protein